MRSLKNLLIQVAVSALWPSYIALLGLAARLAPWPREVSRPASFAILVLALAAFLAALARFVFGPGGWAEETLHAPGPAARQARRACWSLTLAMLLLLLPQWLFQRGLIAHGDRPVTAPSLCRLLGIGYEFVVLIVMVRILRAKAPLMQWLGGDSGWGWIGKRRRPLAWGVIGYVAAIIALDFQGYAYTASRVSAAGTQSTALAAACFAAYLLICRAVDMHAWRWVRLAPIAADSDPTHAPATTEGMARKLKTSAAWAVPILGLIVGSWIWNFDMALLRAIASQDLWPGEEVTLTVGEVLGAMAIFAGTAVIWKHLGAFFAVCVYPRMGEDAGVRFAALTLCRYLVLGVGTAAGMATLHLGPDKIGFGLAALSVGLGFGLQEIVSNFVCGIILLLERPIRVGDVVTVAGMSGKVERIHIRATTIINADNQSLIVPNREFITANLVNWTHKDRIIRVGMCVRVAIGTDADRVCDLLLSIARADADVLRNPVPTASMDGFGESFVNYNFFVHVPDPSLAGRVKHRIYGEIQKKFAAEGIVIPVPSHEVLFRDNVPAAEIVAAPWSGMVRRADPGATLPPSPRNMSSMPAPAEPSHRGVDE